MIGHKLWLRSTGSKSVKTRYGVIMAANWGDATFEFCALGAYGHYLADRLKQSTKPYVFVDVGANQGLYSLLAGKAPNCRRAIALEPVASTFALLKQNIDLNDLKAQLVPLQYGISDKLGTFPIYVRTDHSGVASLSNKSEGAVIEQAEIKTAQELEEYLLPNIPIVMKIDVEGHELEVLRSLRETNYFNRIEWIFCEVDERWLDATELKRLLSEMGLTEFEKVGQGHHYDLMSRRAN